MPDLASLRTVPGNPRHASAMGFFEEREPKDGESEEGRFECEICPRSVLRRIVRWVDGSHGACVLADGGMDPDSYQNARPRCVERGLVNLRNGKEGQ